MLKKAVCLFLAALFLPCSAAMAKHSGGAAIKSTMPSVCAKGAALVEMTSGRLLYGKNESLRLPMASTTKIMTGLLACESGRLGETVTVPAAALRVEGSSMGLQENERITLRDLTYGLMLESGNDAANAIAIALAGSTSAFAAKMNLRAESLGLSGTHFVTPSGLDAADHYTTALDLARLGAYAMQNADFAAIVSTQKIRVTYDGKSNGRLLVNHNRMLSLYDGAVGIKTGFTKKCGRCLVTCAKKDGVCLVVCTLNDSDDWDDHKKLLDYGFSLLKSEKLLQSVAPKVTANVVGGTADTVALQYNTQVTAALRDG
ncbi:MAG: D-alanyl-D-alanine carboxypeptidase, partial [Clostridia bacterium]|nr:D-alanyl-D-alanine carboxypeptidase [Clostridia bacterium]